ncbi:hypothetical protein Verru16b_01524 [Lacunisphaera limnophila]|uniref:DUF7305 domain-containing protein n=1 Tax=Lacunisphaera limnophila TaxID=1838286 RepID=A0A1D8AU84_9BACT|nr:hypothetical protein [Lacunisphaera limnophila]AOS44462.1 hypothetical protein Verru16b_01524 [Lacunisphaera limnophila]
MIIRGSNRHLSARGAVLLVTLCFVAVLAIILGSYIAVCNRAMQLSNRSFQSDLSRQLAESGIEEALRAFNKNDWGDWASGGMNIDWTLDTTNKRATATITYPTTKFGQGVTATVKLRVDNYDVNVLPSAWTTTTNYLPGNIVSYTDGIWYRATTTQLNKVPGSASSYWIQESSPASADMTWVAGSTYYNGKMVLRSGALYRCKFAGSHVASLSNAPGNTTYWALVPYFSSASDLQYTNESVLHYLNANWYRYNSGWDGNLPSGSGWTTRWFFSNATTYYLGDVVRSSTTWYRYINASSSAGNAVSNTSYWRTSQSLAATAAADWNWNSAFNYNIGDVVYSSSRWYRCLVANINKSPSTNPTYWSVSPRLTTDWEPYRQYSSNDLVFHNGVWYLSLLNTNINQNPTSATAYWIGANTSNTSYLWNSTTAYSANAYRSYDGVWYKCLVGNTGELPGNTTYWTATWAQSSGISTGAPMLYAEATVNLGDRTTSRIQLRAPVTRASLFPNAIGASSTLTITGGTGTIDSYNSALGTSYASQIGTSTNYSAVVAAGSAEAAGTTTLLTIGNGTTVNGYVSTPSSSTSPFAPRTSLGSSATVKSATSPVSPTVDLTRLSRSPYVPQFSTWPAPDIATAFANSNFPAGIVLPTNPAGTVTIGSAGSVTPSVYYYNGSLDVASSGSYEMATLAINGPVILYLNGNLRLRTGGSVIVRETGSLEVHASGGIRIDEASNGIDNQTLDPQKVFLLSDSSGTTTQYYADTTNPFYGVIYAPNTTATLGVDIRTGVTIYGAISARKITFSSEANLHYDTALRYATFGGVDQPYTVTQWRELPVTERATMP